jgi:hypothetical protein
MKESRYVMVGQRRVELPFELYQSSVLDRYTTGHQIYTIHRAHTFYTRLGLE